MKDFDLPLGLGMALAQNTKAMEHFALLSDEEKRGVIEKAHSVNSKNEMQQYVDKIARNETT
jgi:hypothetical protein